MSATAASAEDRQRPERPPPARQLAGEGAQRDADDVGEHPPGADHPERAGAGRRAGGAGGDDRRHGPERPGRPRRAEPRRQQQREAGAERDDDVPGREHRQGEHQGHPARHPPGQQRHRRRADDHPDREDRDQQPGLGHAHVQVAGDLRQQAGDDELGREHEERAGGQDVDDERAARPGRAAASRRPGGRSDVTQGRGVDDEPVADVGGEHPLVGLVDLVGGDDLDLGADAVLGAEVEHLLGLGDAADHRAGVGAAAADQRQRR